MPLPLPLNPEGVFKLLYALAGGLGKVTFTEMLLAFPWALVALAIAGRIFSWELRGPERVRRIDVSTGEMLVSYRLNSLGDLAALWMLVAWIGHESPLLSILISPLVYGTMISTYRKVAKIHEASSRTRED